MHKIKFFFTIFIATFLIGGGALFLFSSKDHAKKLPSIDGLSFEGVKGSSTKRAQEISKEVSSDIIDGFTTAKEHALDVKVSDIVDVVARLQKIPQDFQNMQRYIEEQISKMKDQKNK